MYATTHNVTIKRCITIYDPYGADSLVGLCVAHIAISLVIHLQVSIGTETIATAFQSNNIKENNDQEQRIDQYVLIH